MVKKTRKTFSYDSMSLNTIFRSVFILFFSIVCLLASLKIMHIYAQEETTPSETVENPAEIPLEVPQVSEPVSETPAVTTENPAEIPSEVPQVSEPVSQAPSVPLENTPEIPSSDTLSKVSPSPNTSEIAVEYDPEVAITHLIDTILMEAEREANENPEKDPEDTTDEDPDVDLQDPSLESETPAPELEPVVSMPVQTDDELIESDESSTSLISLLDANLDLIPLLTRTISEEISTDITAKHSCRLEKFRADVSDTGALKMRVKFLAGLKGDYEAEIGSLPTGIDIVFSQNREYIYSLTARDTVLDLEIINQVGSFDGDFSIPIIYRKKGEQDSSVICQMNLLNENSENGE